MKTEIPTTCAFARTGGLETTVTLVGEPQVLKVSEGSHATGYHIIFNLVFTNRARGVYGRILIEVDQGQDSPIHTSRSVDKVFI